MTCGCKAGPRCVVAFLRQRFSGCNDSAVARPHLSLLPPPSTPVSLLPGLRTTTLALSRRQYSRRPSLKRHRKFTFRLDRLASLDPRTTTTKRPTTLLQASSTNFAWTGVVWYHLWRSSWLRKGLAPANGWRRLEWHDGVTVQGPCQRRTMQYKCVPFFAQSLLARLPSPLS